MAARLTARSALVSGCALRLSQQGCRLQVSFSGLGIIANRLVSVQKRLRRQSVRLEPTRRIHCVSTNPSWFPPEDGSAGDLGESSITASTASASALSCRSELLLLICAGHCITRQIRLILHSDLAHRKTGGRGPLDGLAHACPTSDTLRSSGSRLTKPMVRPAAKAAHATQNATMTIAT
eukprot:scaffold7506_cov286-Pinguiococcus_pyrenoidosus.AAC.8